MQTYNIATYILETHFNILLSRCRFINKQLTYNLSRARKIKMKTQKCKTGKCLQLISRKIKMKTKANVKQINAFLIYNTTCVFINA